MKIKLNIFYCTIVVSILLGLAACSKMNSTYYDHIKNGEPIYTGKVDSLQVWAGRNRIKLSWLLISDPSITQCKVFWTENGIPDSVQIPVQRTGGTDTIQTIINNLEENSYTFSVYTYDNQGHYSMASNITGDVYGDRFVANLSNRLINGGELADNGLLFSWSSPPDTVNINTMVYYTDTRNQVDTLYLPFENDSLLVPDYQFGTTIYYKSSYIPQRNAIDTFWVPYSDSLVINP